LRRSETPELTSQTRRGPALLPYQALSAGVLCPLQGREGDRPFAGPGVVPQLDNPDKQQVLGAEGNVIPLVAERDRYAVAVLPLLAGKETLLVELRPAVARGKGCEPAVGSADIGAGGRAQRATVSSFRTNWRPGWQTPQPSARRSSAERVSRSVG
jgi:hypothetical protein